MDAPTLAVVAPVLLTVTVLRYLLAAGIMAAVVAWLCRRGRARFIQARRAGAADVRREIRASLRTSLVFGVVGVATVAAIRAGWVPRVENPAAWQMIASTVAILIWHDTWFYWTHRAMHDRRVFGWMHREHHRSVTPTAWAAYSFSVWEALVQAAFLPLWMLVVPTPDGAAVLALTVMIVRNVMGHSGVELHGRGWADHPVLQWINTTVHHDLHHAGGFGSNYGLYFTWWDRLMGTENVAYRARFRELTDAPPGRAPW